jgi:hypothetical protein
MSLTLVFSTEVFLFDSWRIVLEGGNSGLPREEKNALFTVRGNLLRVARVELNPVLVLELLCVLKL